MPKKLSNEEFIEKAKKMYGNEFDYSLCKYTGSGKLVTIICKKHGPFNIIANNFLRGHKCPVF